MSSRPGLTLPLNLPQRVMISAPFWRSVMFDVCGQEACWWTIYTSSPLNGVPKCVSRPFAQKGLIVENRTSDDEDVARLADINDIRNGVLVNRMIRRAFDRRFLAILKVCHFCPPICTFSDPFAAINSQTPNHIIKTTDIPPCHNRTDLASDVVYPPHKRYTLQWLEGPSPADTNMIPNDSDATFKKATKRAKLSDLLLHYTYGAAAVRRWGVVRRSLRNSPLLLVHRSLFQRQQGERELCMIGMPLFESVPKAGGLVKLAQGVLRLGLKQRGWWNQRPR